MGKGKGPVEIARIAVQKRAVRIEDLEDKVHLAVQLYQTATEKYQRGEDSIKEWNTVIKALSAQLEEVREFVAMAHHNLGVVYGSRHKFEQAVKCFEQAVATHPDYAMAHYNLAVMYRKMGDPVRAERSFRRSKQLGYDPRKKGGAG